MSTAFVWILLAVSHGPYNRGVPVVVGTFGTEAECAETKDRLSDEMKAETRWHCLKANAIQAQRSKT
jgi:hypothetical protein